MVFTYIHTEPYVKFIFKICFKHSSYPHIHNDHHLRTFREEVISYYLLPICYNGNMCSFGLPPSPQFKLESYGHFHKISGKEKPYNGNKVRKLFSLVSPRKGRKSGNWCLTCQEKV